MHNELNKQVIGMVHVRALPGTPLAYYSVSKLISQAKDEAKLLYNSGFDAIMLENMHDLPYLNRYAGPEITSSLTAIACSVKSAVPLPIGLQVLAGANKTALAIALAAKLDFIRAEGFVYSQISDEGLISSDAGKLLRYRRNIGAEHIKIYCDIKKKHASHSLTSDISIKETAKAAEFFLADGVIITGKSTGLPADNHEVKDVRETVNCPIFIGSGITAENLAQYWNYADGFIVGSYLKFDGVWSNELSEKRCQKLIEKVERLRNEEKRDG